MADPPAGHTPNRLIHGDNLHVMRALPDSTLDLIYIDPPFFTGRTQGSADSAGAFGDTWDGDILRYLDWLTPRLAEMHRLLMPAGSIYVHLDWHAVHYVKVELDRIFGAGCFLNDIAWLYGLGGSSARYWPRKHDRLLWYSRTANGHWFEAARVPARSRRMQGRTKKAPDWWDMPSLNNMSSERLGYPTQKPEALLERIIASSCPPGGFVADFFAGSGTTAAVAARLGRRWLACDSSREAIDLSAARLERGGQQDSVDYRVEWWGE